MSDFEDKNDFWSFESKSGKNIIFRLPKTNDLHDLHAYINKLSKEKIYTTFQGETISIEDEKSYLETQLENIKKQTAFQLLAFYENTLIGVCGIDMLEKVEAHIGEFGVSIDKEYRGEGIGQKFCEVILENAKTYLPNLEIITLKVYSENKEAIDLYVKLGFEHYGTLPLGVKIQGENMDLIHMYKCLL